MKFTEKRVFVWMSMTYRFSKYDYQTQQGIPIPHTSGDWTHGFEFNNGHWLQLAVL